MNPIFGTFIGWCLSFLYGRERKLEGLSRSRTVWFVKRMMPGWAAAQTWGRIILVVGDRADGHLLRHELEHVRQWETLGLWGIVFMLKYLWYTIRFGYWNNPLEVDARENSQ